MSRCWLGLALLAACTPEPQDTAVQELTRNMVRATRVSATNADELLLVGVRADGRVGDYAITNGSLTAVIDAPDIDEDLDVDVQQHRSPSGGTLIDLAAPGGKDALPQILQVVGFDPALRVLYQVATVESDGKEIHAIGRILDPERKIGVALDDDDLVEQLVVSTTWRMWDRVPWIEVETVVTNNTGRSVELDPIADLIITDGVGGAPYVPLPGLGYELEPGVELLTPWLVLDADPELPGAMAVLSLETEDLWVMPEQDLDGRVRGVYVGVEDQMKDAIATGEQRGWTRRYTASAGLDMTGVTQNVLELLAQQTGSRHLALGFSEGCTVQLDLDVPRRARATFHRVDPARYVDDEGNVRDGGVMPITTAWSDGDDPGVDTWLSLGRYAVEIESAAFRSEVVEIDVQHDLVEYGIAAVGDEPLTTVELSLLDSTGQGNIEPLRLDVVGLGGTEDPELGRYGQVGDELAAGRRVWTDAEHISLRLPDGAYRFILSRGPRFPLASAEIRVPVDTALELTVPSPVIEGGAWVEADPFSASRSSIFGGDTAEDIAFAMCAEGIELLVRAEAGGGDDAVAGCEGQQVVTGALAPMDVPRTGASAGDGWIVGFPIDDELPTSGMRPGTWLDQAWGAGAQVTAVLAPRARGAAGAASGMFHARGFERSRVDDGDANRFLREASEDGTYALDATALEIISAHDPWHSSNVLQDWLALLQAGYLMAPVASSHSSWLAHDHPGAARTLIATDALELEERLAALADGRTIATSGPVLEVVLRGDRGEAGPGESLAAPSGETLELEVRLRAADWVPVERLRVFRDGDEIHSVIIEQDGVLDITETFEVAGGAGSWLVVDAGRPELEPGGDFALVNPGMPAYAVTAPIVLDTAGQ